VESIVESGRACGTEAKGFAGGLVVDPCEYEGWDKMLEGSGDACVFHGSGWARVLKETYGHRPFYFCRVEEGRIREMLPVMEVSSRWTGRRGVSLPFTDLVRPLGQGENGFAGGRLYEAAMETGRSRGWKYLECRGNDAGWSGGSGAGSVEFWNHTVDVSVGPDAMFRRFEGAVRRGIRKAEQGGLVVEQGTDRGAVETYYELHCRTRKRHGLPPQPKSFFDSIGRFILEAGHGLVVIARTEGRAVAGAMFFCFGEEGIYKFGASDYRFQQLRANNLVMWEGLKRLAQKGVKRVELGRTSVVNEGLRRFKLGFGASEERVQYSRFDFRKGGFVKSVDRAEGRVNALFRMMPVGVLRVMGRGLYRHMS
jgi:hypothetical protein